MKCLQNGRITYNPESLAMAIGRAMIFASPQRMATLERIYERMLPEAKAACDLARSWLSIDGDKA